jgi:hypothetical protein
MQQEWLDLTRDEPKTHSSTTIWSSTRNKLIILFLAFIITFGSIRALSYLKSKTSTSSESIRVAVSKTQIYTFFDSTKPEDLKLLEIWKKSWSAYGWNPVVLNIQHAMQHPKFKNYETTFSQFPSVDNDMSCYYRLIAMIVVDGGFMSDFHVINYGFLYPTTWDWQFTTHEATVPSLVSASREEYQRVVDLMASVDVNLYKMIFAVTPHLSDTLLFEKFVSNGHIRQTTLVGDIYTPLTRWSYYRANNKPLHQVILEQRSDPIWNKK